MTALLQGLRDIATEEGALLCFDEVMTGFRIAKGCAQAHFGITPDLTTMGKVIGGGLPVGAYGGRKDIMQTVAPAGPMYQVGAPVYMDPLLGVVCNGCLWQMQVNLCRSRHQQDASTRRGGHCARLRRQWPSPVIGDGLLYGERMDAMQTMVLAAESGGLGTVPGPAGSNAVLLFRLAWEGIW